MRVYFSFNVAQGVYQPITPMGIQAFRLLASGFVSLWGVRYADPAVGPSMIVEAGHRPIVLKGDFIQPSLAVRECYGEEAAGGRVRAVFLYEEEGQIARNYPAREGREQEGRARASWRYSEWLPVVAARPWETVLERCVAAVEGLAVDGATRVARS